ncbi:MAG: glutamyl-tRNA reductase, partial [Candidatus Omnitrophota bacterium]|nr:glutamyl-tRNA reductase [Candidatus Omnitrophota bacterium]
AVILSTCNRTEIYAFFSDNKDCGTRLMEFLCAQFSAQARMIKKYFYIFKDEEAIRHIFKVACGLDSQVLGETEILGQVRSAWSTSRAAGLTNCFLDAVFEKAVETGAAVRQSTKISQGNVSIGSVAMKMLKGRFRSLKNKTALIIGAGKIAGSMSKYLKNEQIKGFFVSNRTYPRACELARECNGEAIRFNRLHEKLNAVDIVISSTASPHIILRKPLMEEVMDTRRKPLLLLDLAVPRDIDPAVRDIGGLILYDLDDLKCVIEENYNNRKKEAVRVQEMIEEALKELYERELFNTNV